MSFVNEEQINNFLLSKKIFFLFHLVSHVGPLIDFRILILAN